MVIVYFITVLAISRQDGGRGLGGEQQRQWQLQEKE